MIVSSLYSGSQGLNATGIPTRLQVARLSHFIEIFDS